MPSPNAYLPLIKFKYGAMVQNPLLQAPRLRAA